MTKDELRRMFLDNMPKQIVTGHQISYVEWLEQLIVKDYVVNKNAVLQPVRSSFVCGHPPNQTFLNDGIWHCQKCGGKWKSLAKK